METIKFGTGYLGGRQQRYRKKSSCGMNMLDIYDGVSNILEKWDKWVDYEFLDCQKDFGTVPHRKQTMRLHNQSGIRERLQ